MITFLLICLSAVGWAAESATGPEVEYERLVEAAFPKFKLQRVFFTPTSHQKLQYQNILNETVGLLEVTGQIWAKALTAGDSQVSVKSNDLQNLLKLMKRMPLWICEKECEGIGSSMSSARGTLSFLRSKKIGNLLAAIIVVRACAFEAQGCERKTTREQLILALQSNLAELAYIHFYGELKASKDFATRIKEAFGLSQKAFSQIKSIRNRCLREPREGFDLKAMKYLLDQGHLTPLDSSWENCAQQYHSAIQQLVKRAPGCLAHSAVEKKLSAAKFYKIDGPGYFMTCGSDHGVTEVSQPIPVLRRFEEQWVLGLPEASCDGVHPKWMRALALTLAQTNAACLRALNAFNPPLRDYRAEENNLDTGSATGVDIPLLE